MLEDSLLKHYPKEIRLTQERINGYEADIALYERYKSEDFPGMLLYGTHYAEKKEAGTAILEACKAMTSPEPKEVGSYRGFTLLLSYDIVAKVFRMTLRGELSHIVELGSDIHGNIQRMENMLESLPSRLSACEKALATLKEQMENVGQQWRGNLKKLRVSGFLEPQCVQSMKEKKQTLRRHIRNNLQQMQRQQDRKRYKINMLQCKQKLI